MFSGVSAARVHSVPMRAKGLNSSASVRPSRSLSVSHRTSRWSGSSALSSCRCDDIRPEGVDYVLWAVDQGLIPMAGKLRWDSLWLGVKRADQLLTICHCCDCCCYFKMYRYLPREAARGLQKLEGLEVRVEAACDGCGLCAERCFIKAMTLKEGKAVVGESCRGCGRCAAVCPRKAVTLALRPSEMLDRYQNRIIGASDLGHPQRAERKAR